MKIYAAGKLCIYASQSRRLRSFDGRVMYGFNESNQCQVPSASQCPRDRKTIDNMKQIFDWYADRVLDLDVHLAVTAKDQTASPAPLAHLPKRYLRATFLRLAGRGLRTTQTCHPMRPRATNFGQRYFESRFGLRNCVAWLPDGFGLTGGLPQGRRSLAEPLRIIFPPRSSVGKFHVHQTVIVWPMH
jgi:hypothetical protein